MRHKNSRKTVAKKRRAGGTCPSFRYGQKYVWIFMNQIVWRSIQDNLNLEFHVVYIVHLQNILKEKELV